MTRHSTSPPCGNLVDGLPHDCHTETIAKLASLGPAKNGTTPPEFGRVDNILEDEFQENRQNIFERMSKINMDVIKCRKCNARARLMGFQIFENFQRMRIPRKIEIFNFGEEKAKKL